MNETETLPMISIIVPARNEEGFIEPCVRQILASDYPHDGFEVIVVDGMSDDRRIAAADPRVRLVENPRRITPVAFNLGIKAARGDVVFLQSAHSTGRPDYFIKCVRILQEHPEVWCAGGADNTIGEGFMGSMIAAAMVSPIGAGNARYRLGHYKGYVDTLTGGTRRWVFDKVGLYDEELIRNQDDEFNFRVLQAGGKIYLDSDIVCDYYPRDSLRKLARQYYQYGFWRIRTIQKHRQPASLRQVLPLGFVVAWLVLGIGTIFCRPIGYALAAWAGFYALGLLYGVVDVARRTKICYALLSPLAFMTMHFSYGLGSLMGVWSFLILRRGGKISEVQYPLSR